MFQTRRGVRGQATTEYILIVVLVAVLSIGIITVFGNQVRDLFRVATENIGGVDGKLDPSITAQAQPNVVQGLQNLKGGGN
jgi:pilus assembly protein Flp/PilA